MILHPQLNKDCSILGKMQLSLVLLLNDSRYPWIILVPQQPNLCELIDLERPQQLQLLDESNQVQQVLLELYSPEKLNVGALGNLVPQLHLHHIARFADDPAWPAPVWGHSPATPYDDDQLEHRSRELIEALSITKVSTNEAVCLLTPH